MCDSRTERVSGPWVETVLWTAHSVVNNELSNLIICDYEKSDSDSL